MPYNLIPIAIIVLALLAIVFVILRKFPELVMIDVSTIPQERDIKTKEKILQERLERQLREFFNRFLPVLKKTSNNFQKFFKKLYQKIVTLEKDIEKKHLPKNKQGKLQFANRLQQENEKAEDLIEEKKFSEAEEMYIKVLSDDPKNIEAYRGLMMLYEAQKEYEKAGQTGVYLLKLLRDDAQKAEIHCHLGEIKKKEKNYSAALSHFQKALGFSENNPKYLDYLLEMSIMVEDKDLALATFEKLHVANPDNKKLKEYKAQIENLIVKQGS